MSADIKLTWWEWTKKFFNAPFTLWVLSLVFLTLGGAYFTTLQQCQRDFDQFKERYHKIASEYFERRQLMAVKLIEVRTLDDIKKAISLKEGLYYEFRERPFFEIDDEFKKMVSKVDFLAYVSAKANVRINNFLQSESYSRFQPLIDGELIATTKDIPSIREFGADYAIYLEDEIDLYVRSTMSACCGIGDLIHIALGKPTQKARVIAVGGFLDFAEEYVKSKAAESKSKKLDEKTPGN